MLLDLDIHRWLQRTKTVITVGSSADLAVEMTLFPL